MRHFRGFAIALAALLFIAAGRAQALSLSVSSPVDTSKLTVGQSFTVDVTLSGLSPGQKLTMLDGTSLFFSTLLGTPTSITAGSIIPGVLFNPTDFQTSAAPGQASASFDTASPSSVYQITSNGVFFSFNVTAKNVGTGSIFMNPAAISAGQGATQDSITTPTDVCDNLVFSIAPSVPEPRTSAIGLLAAIAAGGFFIVRHRKLKIADAK